MGGEGPVFGLKHGHHMYIFHVPQCTCAAADIKIDIPRTGARHYKAAAKCWSRYVFMFVEGRFLLAKLHFSDFLADGEGTESRFSCR